MFCLYLWNLEASGTYSTLAALGILQQSLWLLNPIDTSKTLSNYYLYLEYSYCSLSNTFLSCYVTLFPGQQEQAVQPGFERIHVFLSPPSPGSLCPSLQTAFSHLHVLVGFLNYCTQLYIYVPVLCSAGLCSQLPHSQSAACVLLSGQYDKKKYNNMYYGINYVVQLLVTRGRGSLVRGEEG